MRKQEPYAAQVLRRLWDDRVGMMHEYDEMAENSDHEGIKCFVQSTNVQYNKDLDQITRIWHAHPLTKALRPPMGMEPVPPPDEDFEAYMGGLDGDDPMSSSDYESYLMDQGAEGAGEGLEAGQDFMEGLGTQLGPNAEMFHKCLKGIDDFLAALLQESAEEPESQDRKEDAEDQPPLTRKKKKSFSRGDQAEARNRASALEEYQPQIDDLDLQSTIAEVIRLLRGLTESRQKFDSEEPLSPHEVDAIGKQEKALRSILKGKKGRWPKRAFSTVSKAGHKSLDVMLESAREQSQAIENLQQDLERLVKAL